ncbi:MAG: T9SS type A sorting domain-containing protein [Melioribacter sp.]|nr:T9SS type A sorting domain-containing protein [Melioribacter sp.]
MKLHTLIFLFLLTISLAAQTVVTTIPTFPTQTDQITITFDVTYANPSGKTPLGGYFGSVYAHTGVTLVTNNGTPQRWQKVKGNWGDNTVQPQLTNTGSNKYQIVINNPRTFFQVTDASQKITELCFVLRSSDGSKQTEDIFVPLYSSGISIIFNTPTVNVSFGDPLRSPVFVSEGGNVPISISIAEVGTKIKSVKLFVNADPNPKAQSITNSLNYTFNASEYSGGKNEVKVVATDTANVKDSSTFVIMRNPTIKNLAPPQGTIQGINYGSDPTKVTLALYAPQKSFIYVIGEFGNSDWKVDTTYLLNKYIPNSAKPDSIIWWTTISNLTAGQEYAYQYLIDGNLRVFDPYIDKILDPSNDSGIPSSVYPNLKSYPANKTDNIVGVLQTGQSSYNWKVAAFNRPSKEKLVIYEMLVRDFVSTHSYKTLIDTLSYFKKLGVNAIELMPISEFDGNDSWGYNPMTYFAPDKYYGTKTDLKAFIDACHQNGIAVIQDIVLNHAYNNNSMARMYWDNGHPAANNPWFNVQSNFANPDAHWGNDFNHESKATQYFVDRVLQYWLTEFKIDGFRFDFTKGFGNTYKPLSDIWGSIYDPVRISLLKRMVDKIWSYDPTAIMIFEHLAENREDQELAQYGILMWGNMNYSYNEATMGYVNTSNFNGISYQQRGWSVPNLVGYMESHDEERLMYKNKTYGNSSQAPAYDIKNLSTALNRIKLAATFFITVPGPKMIWQFGELGYDISIDYNGRLGKKPIPWSDGLNYYSDTDRKSLFNVFAALIRLKKNYPAFSSTDFSLATSVGLKRIKINHSSMNVVIVGNFDVSTGSLVTDFQSTGKWYEFFSGDSLDVTDVGMQITLQPGEYRLYTSKKIPKASDIITNVTDQNTIPTQFKLEQNYPNPFNPSTVISYQLTTGSLVTLKVYDLLGREVATLVNEFQQAGIYNSQFSIHNSQLSSGVYFYRLQAGDFVQTKKMLLIK